MNDSERLNYDGLPGAVVNASGALYLVQGGDYRKDLVDDALQRGLKFCETISRWVELDRAGELEETFLSGYLKTIMYNLSIDEEIANVDSAKQDLERVVNAVNQGKKNQEVANLAGQLAEYFTTLSGPLLWYNALIERVNRKIRQE